MRVADLNSLDDESAVRALLGCCGSTHWAQAMAAARPFASIAAVEQAAEACWETMPPPDILEAFAAHPKIGGTKGAGGAAGSADDRAAHWSAQEQSGVTEAPDDVQERLAAGNRAYEARFGYIFIICATGRSAAEMLASLERRLRNTPADELRIAAGEQRAITRLRLRKLLDMEENR
jgi:2-oxo-4-hydroxy-4-carboxy-5-ureidoimidazoline decarboxylase